MSKRSLRKNSIREIKQSIGRYIAILAIVALGVGFFAGLQVTKEAMIVTADNYFRDKVLFDYRLVSTLGLYDEDVEEISGLSFVKEAEGAYSTDAIIDMESGVSNVAKIHSISEKINRITVTEGRLPEDETECVVDSKWPSDISIGDKIVVSEINSEDTLNMFKKKELTVSGFCKASMYVNFERGNTTLGNGKITGFVYVLPGLFDTEYYTEVYVSSDASKYRIYSDEYNDASDIETDALEEKLSELANGRYNDLYNDALSEIEDGEREIADAYDEIEENEKKLSDAETEITENESKLSDGWSSYYDGLDTLETMKAFLPPAMYDAQLKELSDAKEELIEAEGEIEDAKAEVADGYREIEDAKKEIKENEEKLSEAREELADFKAPDTYVLGRGTNIGYACYDNDSSIVEGIGDVFPVFFFLVAALVCMTTMNRMVEEKRTEIGTMKALGYSEASIMRKYLFYSGSAAIVGCVGGFFAGLKVFPMVIWSAYNIMYTISDIVFVIDWKLGIISLIVAVLCSMGATYLTIHTEMRSTAADLIRPKAPANGKRVFLEKIGFIWKHLKFTSKVSIRNVFRYQKRFWMMVLGVGGCYGLLITGMGIKDSIADVCDCQFNNIQKYDMTVTFNDDSNVEERDEFENLVENPEDYIYVQTKSVDVDYDGAVKSATLVAFSDMENSPAGSEFINFMDEKDNPVMLPKTGEAILSAKMAGLLGVNVGDEVILRDPDLVEIPVIVSGIMKNYVYNWAYINAETYRSKYKDIRYNTAFVKTDSESYEFAAKVGKLDYVSVVSLTDEMSVRIDSMMDSLNEVVLLVIFCAAALAFIVMYNLTNINITERLREIATLKVLGFYPGETGIYVFRENFILTAFGCIAGLFMGYALHRFVMFNINVEAVTFDTKILPQSYLYGVLLTFLFAVIVDFALAFKLDRIKMAESLKSVE